RETRPVRFDYELNPLARKPLDKCMYENFGLTNDDIDDFASEEYLLRKCVCETFSNHFVKHAGSMIINGYKLHFRPKDIIDLINLAQDDLKNRSMAYIQQKYYSHYHTNNQPE